MPCNYKTLGSVGYSRSSDSEGFHFCFVCITRLFSLLRPRNAYSISTYVSDGGVAGQLTGWPPFRKTPRWWGWHRMDVLWCSSVFPVFLRPECVCVRL